MHAKALIAGAACALAALSAAADNLVRIPYNDAEVARRLALPPHAAATTTLDWGTVDLLWLGGGPQKFATVQNTGQQPITFNWAYFSPYGLGSYYVSGGTCTSGLVLARNATCTVGVSYSPHGVGPETSTLRVGFAEIAGEVQSPLTGRGRGALFTFSSWGRPATPVNTPYSKTITVTNVGDMDATGISYEFAWGSPVYTTSGCTSIAAGASCNLTITLAPQSTPGLWVNIMYAHPSEPSYRGDGVNLYTDSY